MLRTFSLIFISFFSLFLSACDSFLKGTMAGSSASPSTLNLEKTSVTIDRNWTAVGAGSSIIIVTKDQFGNSFYLPDLSITFSSSGGTSKGWFTDITDNEDGSYTVDFVGVSIGTALDIDIKVGGEDMPITKPQISVKNPRLAFTGNSSPLVSAVNRVFTEVDGGFTLTGTCDVELGNVVLTGNINPNGSTTPCNSSGGGTFSIFLNYEITQPYVYTGGKTATIKATQSTLKNVETTIFKINSANPPIIISTLAELQSMACNDSTVFYILANDIDVAAESGASTNNWTPLCTSTYFRGAFDGNNFTISNVHINSGSNFDYGFFAQTLTTQLSNLNFNNLTVISDGIGYTGGLVGDSAGVGEFKNIQITGGSISGGGSRKGGLIGFGSAIVTNSSFSGSVSGGTVGGIMGNGSGDIYGCQVFGTISGSDYVGGIVGSNNTGSISNSSSNATVYGNNYVGGIAGSSRTFLNNYFTGSVSGISSVGGLIGETSDLPKSSYFAGSVTITGSNGGPLWGEYTGGTTPSIDDLNYYLDTATCGGCDQSVGFASKTEEELKTQSTFGWNFYNVYKIDESVSMPVHW